MSTIVDGQGLNITVQSYLDTLDFGLVSAAASSSPTCGTWSTPSSTTSSRWGRRRASTSCFPVPDQTVLTTGANSGIGLATVVEVAKRGFHSVGSVRSAQKAKVVHQTARAAGVEVDTVLLDVTDAAACQRVMADLDLYGLVNNAGYGVTGAVEDVGDDEARALFETMVHAPMRLARLSLPSMRGNGGGRIVNISSIAGLATMPFAGHYTGVKHALEALSDALRVEVAGDGVKVVLVEPGGFKTGIWDELQRNIDQREADGTRHGSAYRRSLQGQRTCATARICFSLIAIGGCASFSSAATPAHVTSMRNGIAADPPASLQVTPRARPWPAAPASRSAASRPDPPRRTRAPSTQRRARPRSPSGKAISQCRGRRGSRSARWVMRLLRSRLAWPRHMARQGTGLHRGPRRC